uniref:MaoC-like domain-containing protein n=1 Tax=Aplanochytrium stocchinoi TaxID=215587 RepID=A0A7S3V2K7_9STRA|mmetsp:Transcript_8054/g.9123  ORF Transcript_8054/g.9123 Transcript_8054/m.9123 type:complete len:107 (+) Transcript_8054:152-472(+)
MAQAPMRLVVGGNLAIKGSLAKAGQYLLASRVFTSDLVRNFAELSLDYNPIHLDADSAREANGYEKPIVHGMLYSSMFSAMFATKLPGSIYRSQTLSFHAPVYIGE